MSVDWIAVDWGTSNLRAWGISPDGTAGPAVESDRGMGKLTREQFPEVLNEICAGFAGTGDGPLDVWICGMAGARQGWLEAPYLEAPTALNRLADGAVRPAGASARFAPRILPGICQRTAGEEDVMRGEETQLLGLLSLRPGYTGTVVMPGTHSKWAIIDSGRLVRFSTAMTGELFEIIGTHSVLRHSLAGRSNGPETEAGVAAGLAAGLQSPERLTGLLFKARAASLLSNRGPDWCSGYLSGLLVGAEVGGHKGWISGTEVIPLIGSARLGRIYGAALAQIGIQSEIIDATQATIAGLQAARHQEQA